MERERTPESARELGIQRALRGLSLWNTVSLLDSLGVGRLRKAVHGWIQKADLQPTDDENPNHAAIDETVSRINDQQYWLSAAGDLATNLLLHARLFATTTALTVNVSARTPPETRRRIRFFRVDGAQHLETALARAGLRFQTMRHGNRNAIEPIFGELKRRTSSVSNCFSHAEPETVED